MPAAAHPSRLYCGSSCKQRAYRNRCEERAARWPDITSEVSDRLTLISRVLAAILAGDDAARPQLVLALSHIDPADVAALFLSSEALARAVVLQVEGVPSALV